MVGILDAVLKGAWLQFTKILSFNKFAILCSIKVYYWHNSRDRGPLVGQLCTAATSSALKI